MNKIFLLVCLVVLTLSWSIAEKKNIKVSQGSHSQSLTFENTTGSCVTPTEISTFKSAVFAASQNWRDDIQRNLDYIRNYMNNAIGGYNENYDVFIQEFNYTKSNWMVYSVNGCNVATFKGINPNNPSWSYMFIRDLVYKTSPYSYLKFLGKGSGINSVVQAYLTKAITDLETASVCDCSQAQNIWKSIVNYKSQYWSLICDSDYDLNAYIPLSGDQWLYTRPNLCYYFIFVT